MANLGFSKTLDALPLELTPNMVYLIKTGQRVTMWVADSAGEVAYKVQGSDEGIEPFLLLGVQGG